VRALLACEGPRQNQLPRFEILTPFESAWLQKHYGNTFKGFNRVGMEIFKHEFKEEGRSLLRAIMSYSGSSHTLDSLGMPLTEKEMAWLKGRWNTELELLQSYRLSIDKDNDREVGRRLVRALMPDDLDENSDTERDIVTNLGEMLVCFDFSISSRGLSANNSQSKSAAKVLKSHHPNYRDTSGTHSSTFWRNPLSAGYISRAHVFSFSIYQGRWFGVDREMERSDYPQATE
jgi:hypothetical protein